MPPPALWAVLAGRIRPDKTPANGEGRVKKALIFRRKAA